MKYRQMVNSLLIVPTSLFNSFNNGSLDKLHKLTKEERITLNRMNSSDMIKISFKGQIEENKQF